MIEFLPPSSLSPFPIIERELHQLSEILRKSFKFLPHARHAAGLLWLSMKCLLPLSTLFLFSPSTEYLTLPPPLFVVKLEHAQHFFLSRQFIFKSMAKNAAQYILKQMFLVIISIIFQPLHGKYDSEQQQNKTQQFSISKRPQLFISNLSNNKKLQ